MALGGGGGAPVETGCESSLVPGGGDDEVREYWGSRQSLRAFWPAGPALTIQREGLTVCKGGALWQAAEVAAEEARKNSPAEPPPPMPWDTWGASLKTLFLGDTEKSPHESTTTAGIEGGLQEGGVPKEELGGACVSCGGWGLGLLGDDKMCAHCRAKKNIG